MMERFLECLKKNKLRITEPRKEVYRVLSESEKALSAKNVFAVIKENSKVKTDKVSVYRNLSLFSELGLVHRFQDGKYSICTHSHSDPVHNHLHIVANCTLCGSTLEINSHSNEVCKAINKVKSLVVSFGKFERVTLQGACKDCQAPN